MEIDEIANTNPGRSGSIAARLAKYGSSTASENNGSQLAEFEEVEEWMQLQSEVVLDENLLDYWVEKGRRYPHLASAALFLHKIPCSSIPSERLFSTSGRIVSDPKRASLNGFKLSMMCVLNSNSDLL